MSDFKNSKAVYDFCEKIYGDTKDGSFGACLHYNSYQAMRVQEELDKIKREDNTNQEIKHETND